MSDVSTYEVQRQVSEIERRIEKLEHFQTDELARRERRKDLYSTLALVAGVVAFAIIWTVIITVAIVEK